MKRYLPLFAIIALLGAFAAQTSTAAAASPKSPAFSPYAGAPVEVEFDDEEGEEEGGEEDFELEECAAEDFGFEFDDEEGEEELSEAEEEELEEECGDTANKDRKGSPFVTAPAACKVSRAESTITTAPSAGQVRLTVRYRTWAPTPVTVALKLRDGKGTIALGRSTEHLGGRGVLHVTTKLGDAVMDRALKASEFDVSLLAPKTPGFCADALQQRLRSNGRASATSRRVYSS